MSLRDAPRSSESNGAQGMKNRRKRRRAYSGLVVGLVALSVSISACSGGDQGKSSASASTSASPSATVSTSPAPVSTSPSVAASTSPAVTPSKKPVVEETVSSYTGWNLQKAVANARRQHVRSVSYADASELGRSVVHTSNWKVCSQRPSAGTYSTATKLAFKIVEANESCAHPPRSPSGNTSSSGGSSSSGSTRAGSGGSTSTGSSARAGSGGSTSTGGSSSTKTQLCSIRSSAGNCYHAGQFCRKADVGASTTDASGREITCSYSKPAPTGGTTEPAAHADTQACRDIETRCGGRPVVAVGADRGGGAVPVAA